MSAVQLTVIFYSSGREWHRQRLAMVTPHMNSSFAENFVLEMLTTSCRATFTNCMNSGLKTSEKNHFLHPGSHIPSSFPQCLQLFKEHLSPLLSTLVVWKEVPSSVSNPPPKSHTSPLPDICTQPCQLVLTCFRRHLEKNTPTFKYKYFFSINYISNITH